MTRGALLAIETSTVACSVAVGVDGDCALRERHEPGAHASHIMAMIDAALEDAGIDMSALAGVVFGHGPGSFTGVRIAVALAQGLAAGIRVPVLGVSSLALLAQAATSDYVDQALLVVQDARMGEVYAGCYRAGADRRVIATRQDALLAPESVTPAAGGVAIGGALLTVPMLRERLVRGDMVVDAALTLPSAREALVLARAAGPDRWTAAERATAVYLRQRVATAKPA